VTALCLVETEDGALTDASARALTLARDLGTDVGAVVFTNGPDGTDSTGTVSESLAPALAAYGVSSLYIVPGIDGYAPQAWARALDELSGFVKACAVVAAGTEHGNEVLAHLGAITGLPMAANCVAVSPASDGLLTVTRQRWAGLLLEDAVLDAPVALLTVATDAVAPVPAATPTELQTTQASRTVSAVTAADLVVRAHESATGGGGQSLASARVVVGGGRGVGSADGFAPLEELASLLGGVVRVSRVVTSEGWRPHTMQVGQTGTKITPDLYLACGISGAIQHFAGCSGAKHIIAINTDPSAPMMTRADYSVVGDLHEVVPALVKALRERDAGG